VTQADLVVTDIGELVTLSQGPIPRVGPEMRELGALARAALAVDNGRFVFVGSEAQCKREVRLRSGGSRWSAAGGTVVPGFVDPHTHVLFAGDRANEIERKISGASYADIAREGGGLFQTVRATRRASEDELIQATAARLRRMAAWGTTTCEVKSGYALTPVGELRLLSLIPPLAERTGLRLVPTFLGAHAIPPEYSDRPDDYISELIAKSLPTIAREHLAEFCDAFCEPGFFTVAQTERLLLAARAAGLGLKVHADEFARSGGAALAARLGCRSAEHLLESSEGDRRVLASAGVTAVLLPVTPLASFGHTSSPGRSMVDSGVPVAIGTDCSPNSWVESMPLVLSQAVYSARLTPAEALTAATVNAAHAIGVADDAGTIAIGHPADFVAFDVPSAEQIPYRFGLAPARVYRRGIPVPPPEDRPR
jgi:imidazolonepropionase